MITHGPIAHLAIVITVFAAPATSLAADGPPAIPPGPPPRPEAVASPNIPRTGPLLNQLYRSNFGAEPAASSDKPTAADPVAMVVELANGSVEAVTSLVTTLDGSVNGVHKNLIFVDLPLAQLPLLAMSDEILRIRRPYRSHPDVISEGLSMHNVPTMHDQGFTGAGVKVGVLDCGGFDGYTALLGTELPASVTLWPGGADPIGTGVHGTGCAEIVHDMAPDAELYLAHNDGEVEFYAAMDWFIAMGVDIISYSCSSTIPAPHDGAGLPHNPVNAKVEETRAAGILFVTSAGNSAEDDTYQHAYTPLPSSNWHDFDGGFGNGWGWLQTTTTYYSVLCWNDWPADPTLSGATNNYDFYLYSTDGSTWFQEAVSSNPQAGNPGEIPCEEIEFTPPANDWYYLGVWNQAADGTHFLDLRNASRATFLRNNPEHSITIPGESPASVAVGAVHWSSQDLEVFSSRGPTLGPGGAPSGGLLKPDLVAADAVSTATYGPTDGQPYPAGTGYFGTSASCPHVAGGAALLLEADPTLDADGLHERLLTSAMDMGTPGPDNDFGAGLMMLEGPAIFADGFESGDTGEWSNTAP